METALSIACSVRILLIEDEKKTSAFIVKGLEEAGYHVETARDGETGLHLALGSRFDLLLVDVMLPKRDGWTVVEELRRDRDSESAHDGHGNGNGVRL